MVTAVTASNSQQQVVARAEESGKMNVSSPDAPSLQKTISKLESAGPEVQNLLRVLIERTDKMQKTIDKLNSEFRDYQIRANESSRVGLFHSGNFVSRPNSHKDTTLLAPNQNHNLDIFGGVRGSIDMRQQNMNQIFSNNNQYVDNSTGFAWGSYSQNEPVVESLEPNGTKKRTRQSWNERYKQLLEYKKNHNHCDVPQTEETGLGIWLSNQRGHYKMYVNGKPSSMTTEKKTMLDELGVTWIIRSKRVSWDERFKELKAFSLEHGHCEVTNSPAYSKLYIWIQNQRTAYKNLQQGKQSSLTPEKLDDLKSIGFNWLFKKDREN